jgi:Domain of unknown function (DUF4173)
VSGGTRLGLILLGAALLQGVLGDVLFRGVPLGLNVPLWVASFVACLVVLLRVARAPLGQGRRWMIAPLVLFAGLVAWRDSPWLLGLDALAIAGAVAIGALRSPSVRLPLAGVVDYAGGLAAAGFAALGGAFPVIAEDIRWRELGGNARRAVAVARGLAIAVPLLVLFGGLFIAADAIFQSLVRSVVPSSLSPAEHIAVVLAWAWVSAGLLRDLVAPRDLPRPARARPTVGIVEIGTVLALVDLLFLAFVVVQFRYLFGGRALVESRTDLTYAQYARHGFFELVVVAALVLPLLLLADWTLRRERRRDHAVFAGLAVALVLLLFAVVASALERLRLYEHAYGLTELRVYATGFVAWLGVVLVWFCATVLRGHRRRFAVGGLVAGFAAVAAMNVLNPDALIARTNVTRPHVDAGYLASLSDDATPTLLRVLPSLPPPQRRRLAAALLARTPSGDWRSWNLDRRRAAAAIERERARLKRLAAS